MSNMLSILNWNVHGLNSLVRREVVRDMILTIWPTVVCLQKTKLSAFTQQLVVQTVGPNLDKHSFLPAEGTRGGILLAWQSDYTEGSNLMLRDFSLSMDFKLKWCTSNFYLTTIYGPTDEEAKQLFLTELISLRPNPTRPWVAIGDFNQMYATSDKNNMNLSRGSMRRFRHALDQCELFELSLQNRRYT
jgi:exonuclease III